MGYISQRTGTASSSYTVYVGYCCSKCANPVISRLTVQSEQTDSMNRLFGVTENELNAQATAECAKLSQRLLQFLGDPKTTAAPPRDKIKGLNSPCPICGNLEPWQDQEMLWKIDAAEQIHIFHRFEDGYSWAQEMLRNRKQASEEALSDPAILQQAQNRGKEIEKQIANIHSEKESGIAAREVSLLSAQSAELEQKLQAASMFSKEKKSLKEELEQCQKSLAAAKAEYQNVSRQLDVQATKLKLEQTFSSFLGKPFLNQALLYENETSIALSLDDGGAHDPVRTLSLSPVPKLVRYCVSSYAKTDLEQLKKAVDNLNASLSPSLNQKEGV